MKRHALDPDNINWTGSEYKLMEQRKEKEEREAMRWFGRVLRRERKRRKQR